MYNLISMFFIIVGMFSADIRMLVFSVVFALIDTLGDFSRREVTHRYIIQVPNPIVPPKSTPQQNQPETDNQTTFKI